MFRWSCFDEKYSFLLQSQESEYPGPKEAELRHRYEDGEIPFDMDEPVRKLLFGIYAGENGKLTADSWNKDDPHLIGSVSALDWDWTPSIEMGFTEENVLEILNLELENFD